MQCWPDNRSHLQPVWKRHLWLLYCKSCHGGRTPISVLATTSSSDAPNCDVCMTLEWEKETPDSWNYPLLGAQRSTVQPVASTDTFRNLVSVRPGIFQEEEEVGRVVVGSLFPMQSAPHWFHRTKWESSNSHAMLRTVSCCCLQYCQVKQQKSFL